MVALGASAVEPLAKAWIKATTDKSPLEYRVGEEMVFTLTPVGVKGALPAGEWFLHWKRSGDDGEVERGVEPFDGTTPFILKTRLALPGFVRLEAVVKDGDGRIYSKPEVDELTPEGLRAMNENERADRAVFCDAGAGAEVARLQSEPEPAEFDAFWKKQFERLELVPLKVELKETRAYCEGTRMYAVRIDCAGSVR